MKAREAVGYLLGLVMFIVLIPALMYWASGGAAPSKAGVICLAVLAVIGIGLSVWSIVYMRIIGKGNPMDAFDHEVAPRTSRLMTRGPYRICRNPMLLGVFIYYIGVVIIIWAWQALAVFIAYFCVMMIQVNFEEKRLERDFGDEYRDYKKQTKKLIPFIW